MLFPVTKVGVIPYHDDTQGVRYFLLHKPAPKRNPDDDVPWGLCRGTRRYRDGDKRVDARDVSQLTEAQIAALEALEETARQEAGEELGLWKLDDLVSRGEHHYVSERKQPYPIHWFAVEMKRKKHQNAEDAAATRWASLNKCIEMAGRGEFKSGYLPILHHLNMTIPDAV